MIELLSKIFADLIVVVHLAFILFVVLGGLFVVKYRCLFVLHAPAVFWAVLLEFRGWYCPLTDWENHFRREAGQAGYRGGFVEHYLLPIIYPPALTPDMQVLLGSLVIVVNLLIYSYILKLIFVK